MKIKGIIVVFAFLALTFSIAGVFAQEDLEVIVDLLEPIVCLEVEDSSLYLGQVTRGYHATGNTTMRNCGNVRSTVTASIPGDANQFFENLRLNSHAGCIDAGWRHWGEFSRILQGPSSVGGSDGQETDLCVRLDLTEYEGPIEADETISTDVTFWITSP